MKEAAELGGSGRNPGERRWRLRPGWPGWRWGEVVGSGGNSEPSIKAIGHIRSVVSWRQRICRARLAGSLSPEVRPRGDVERAEIQELSSWYHHVLRLWP